MFDDVVWMFDAIKTFTISLVVHNATPIPSFRAFATIPFKQLSIQSTVFDNT